MAFSRAISRPRRSSKLTPSASGTASTLAPRGKALSRLVADGLVTVEARKGCVVAPVSWEEFEQLNELRTEIEVSCLRKSIRSGDLKWESGVAAALHRLTRLHDIGFDLALSHLRESCATVIGRWGYDWQGEARRTPGTRPGRAHASSR